MFKYWKSPDGKYSYLTRGCAANAEESQRLTYALMPYFNNFLIVNTCLVKEKQEQSILACTKEIVSRLPKGYKVFITGCSATIHPDLWKEYGIVIPNKDKFNLSSYGINDPGKLHINYTKADVALVEIQEGCNSACTYCIIRKARGASRSFTYEFIKERITEALSQGRTIIRLVGTNLTQYYIKYNNEELRLAGLCQKILNDFPDITLLQTDFIEPESKEVDKLIRMMRTNPRLDKRLDIGVQSFCDEILRRMNRGVTKARLHELYKLAGKDIQLIPDLIVGFPGETHEQFMETVNFLKEYNISDGHVHKYSLREGTPAAKMDGQISEEVKSERVQIIKDVLTHKINKINEDRRKNIVQFELTKQCNNNCSFCYNFPDSFSDIEDKVANLLNAHAFINSDEIINYDGVGFIGGEFFDGQFSTYSEKLLFSELIPTTLYMYRYRNPEIRITSGLMFDDPTFMMNVLKGENMSCLQDYSSIMICTSYDTLGRFTSDKKLTNWKKNMKLLYDELPGIKLHTEIILTGDFIQKVLDGKFSITEFKEKYHTGVDFIEPNSGFFYKDKYEFQKHIPNFFPTRDLFLQFVIKMINSGEINVADLLDVTQKANTLFMVVNGKMMRYDNRHTIKEDLPCNNPLKSGYIDSDENMRKDVLSILESFR